MFLKEEWTQEEFYKYSKKLETKNIDVVLVDTILKPLDKIDTITYNPHLMQKMTKGTVFVFYCDTGKTSKERLSFYKKKFPNHICISLRGGRGYWRPNYQLLEEIEKNV